MRQPGHRPQAGSAQTGLRLLTRAFGSGHMAGASHAGVSPPLIPAYSISKAAAFNLTQSLRALLAARGRSNGRRRLLTSQSG